LDGINKRIYHRDV